MLGRCWYYKVIYRHFTKSNLVKLVADCNLLRKSVKLVADANLLEKYCIVSNRLHFIENIIVTSDDRLLGDNFCFIIEYRYCMVL